MAENHRDVIEADFVLTENGGLHVGRPREPAVVVNVAETGVSWRRLRVKGTPGHGSAPFRSDNALVRAAAVIQRLNEYRPTPRFHELWRAQVDEMEVDDETRERLLDPARIDGVLDGIPNAGAAGYLHACTHTTFSCNAVTGPMKTNVIPGSIDLEVDIRTVPGDTAEDVRAHLDTALGDLADAVEVEPILQDPASISPTDTPLWDALHRSVERAFPGGRLAPRFIVGFTDARIYRQLGAVAYGAGLLSPDVDSVEFGRRFHGNDERIDIESLRLTTQLWVDVARDLLG
jgi:acetylornithine deacetylase/succinyl-diaminopimelate desuccinylase-like protein